MLHDFPHGRNLKQSISQNTQQDGDGPGPGVGPGVLVLWVRSLLQRTNYRERSVTLRLQVTAWLCTLKKCVRRLDLKLRSYETSHAHREEELSEALDVLNTLIVPCF